MSGDGCLSGTEMNNWRKVLLFSVLMAACPEEGDLLHRLMHHQSSPARGEARTRSPGKGGRSVL